MPWAIFLFHFYATIFEQNLLFSEKKNQKFPQKFAWKWIFWHNFKKCPGQFFYSIFMPKFLKKILFHQFFSLILQFFFWRKVNFYLIKIGWSENPHTKVKTREPTRQFFSRQEGPKPARFAGTRTLWKLCLLADPG